MNIHRLIPAAFLLAGGVALANGKTDEPATKEGTGGSGAVSSGVEEGSSALQGQASTAERGVLKDGRMVNNTVVTSATGFFLGQGINATFERPFTERWSWLGAARYSRASAVGGSTTTMGVTAGVDYFLMGKRNEGLRIGPRLDFGFGGQTIGGSTTYASIAGEGELGYNWIASNGITAGAHAGLRFQGDTSDAPVTSSVGADWWTPYASINLGYSW